MSRIVTPHYKILGSGIDWLSLRTSKFDESNSFHALAHEIFRKSKKQGEVVQESMRMGFAGKAVHGLFLGHRQNDSLLTLSSDVARVYGPIALRLGGVVARLDLQVTIDQGNDRYNQAQEIFYRSKVMPFKEGRPRQLMLTQVHPQGDTLNLNKRTTDCYGRIYDYGVAHSVAEKHKIWRFEIELKRALAKTMAKTLGQSEDSEALIENLVHRWYQARIPGVPWTPRQYSWTHELKPDKRPRDVLRWFEESLSVTVARAIKDYGEERTLKALGLSRLTDKNRKEGKRNA